jgi:3D (Asp-Asp-Asp) domain-containing protein
MTFFVFQASVSDPRWSRDEGRRTDLPLIHMSKGLNPVVSTVCVLLLLQVGVAGQTPTKISTLEQPSTITSPSGSNDPSNPLGAAVSDNKGNVRLEVNNMIAAFRGFRMVKLPSSITRTRPRTVVAVPMISVKNPALNFMIVADEARMNESSFPVPHMGIIGDPSVFNATAYSLYGVTRSGVYVRRGVIAADPRVIPLGSVVQISAGKYSGVYTVLDTGKKIKGKIVDLWMPSYREAINFGRQQVKVRVLRRGYKRKTD